MLKLLSAKSNIYSTAEFATQTDTDLMDRIKAKTREPSLYSTAGQSEETELLNFRLMLLFPPLLSVV